MGVENLNLTTLPDTECGWPQLTEAGSILYTTKAIDLKRTRNSDSYIYETMCFEHIAISHPQHIVIGPSYLDAALGTSIHSGRIRPDILVFEADETTWTLSMLVEVKKAKRNGSRRKLQGFSDLLDVFRRDEALLPSLITNIDDTIYIPPSISIPPDSDVHVTFMSPKLGAIIYPQGTDFQVTHEFLKASKKELRRRKEEGQQY